VRTLRSLLLILCALALPLRATADEQRRFKMTFNDEQSQERTIRFDLPRAAVRSDMGASMGFPYEDAVAVQVKAARRYARTVDGPELKVRGLARGISISASGRDRRAMKEAMNEAQAAADVAFERFLTEHRWVRHRGKLQPDHQGLVRDYTDDLVPLATALGQGLDLDDPDDRRAFARRTLCFVQSIPYEKRKRGRDYAGYRRPLAVLGAKKGDCDSKSVLYLAILRAALPDLPVAMLYIPNHAFVAVGLDKHKGDLSVRVAGTRMIVAEPVGPARTSLGDAGKRSKAHVRGGLARRVVVP
jgi:hypothetical protein